MIGCLRVFRLDFFFHFMFSQHFSHVLATFRYKNDLVRVEKREFFCVEYPMVLPRMWYENYPDVWVSFLIGTLLAEKQKCQHLILMTGCNLSVLQSFRNLEHAFERVSLMIDMILPAPRTYQMFLFYLYWAHVRPQMLRNGLPRLYLSP